MIEFCPAHTSIANFEAPGYFNFAVVKYCMFFVSQLGGLLLTGEEHVHLFYEYTVIILLLSSAGRYLLQRSVL